MDFISFFRQVTENLRAERNFGTAHVYRSTLNAILRFHGNGSLPFRAITPEWLKRFEIYLRSDRGCSWNTVSTYFRMLRAVYNRAVELRKAAYVSHLFRSVYTGTRADKKRALDSHDMRKLFRHGSEERPRTVSVALQKTHDLFVLMFLLRGLPFVDLVYLRKSDLRGNVITYRRRKTGRPLSVTLTPEALALLHLYMNRDKDSPYLLPILTGGEGTEETYREYQIALRSFNRKLRELGRALGLDAPLSSYTARHTWATVAYHCEIHPGIISEAMGHSSITVTETYLKPFRSKKIDEANRKVIDFAYGMLG